MAGELPAEYLEGIAGIEVSPKTLPHPVRADIWTLGECVPLPGGDHDPDTVQSRILLYFGSFRALAAGDPDFDWREETWETLTHELRHHLEWRARAPDLEALDRAAEANYARQDGEPFDLLYFHDGERVANGVYRIEDDFFLEQVVRAPPARVGFAWHGRSYQADAPEGLTLPALLTVSGVTHPPPGELLLVLRPRPGVRDLFRPPTLYQGVIEVRPDAPQGAP
jgi:hypothetical protein